MGIGSLLQEEKRCGSSPDSGHSQPTYPREATSEKELSGGAARSLSLLQMAVGDILKRPILRKKYTEAGDPEDGDSKHLSGSAH